MLSCSSSIRHEYCCTVVKIGECFPIEGADRIQRTLVNGMSMIISKTIRPGDIMIYAANETALHPDFLKANNLYGISDYTLNANAAEIEKLLETDPSKAKSLCGFFTKQNRVKMLKLKGTYSFGFLFSPQALVKWYPKLQNFRFSAHINEDFDVVDGILFVKAYIPVKKEPDGSDRSPNKSGQHERRFNRLIDENFRLHYDTKQLQRNMSSINPKDVVTVSVKVHGTSAIYSRIECRIPKKLPIHTRIWNKLVNCLRLPDKYKVIDYTLGQDSIYSSRTTIRNKYVRPNHQQSTTTTDIYGEYNDKLAKFLPDNTIVYGEIFGYNKSGGVCIQKNYDYGLPVNQSRFMPYRITRFVDGQFVEWDVQNVRQWTVYLIRTNPELQDVLYPIPILYHGKLTELYPDIPVDEHWHTNVLEAMKADKEHFGMEANEPLCRNKVPREGICLRVDGCPHPEAFKLKCVKFLSKESKDIDAGEIDAEMQESGYDE